MGKFIRTVKYGNTEIKYLLEQKQVKNLNLRINAAGEIHVSANPVVALEKADAFVLNNAEAILAALQKFADAAKKIPKPKLYENGEIFYLLGKKLQLRVQRGNGEFVLANGKFLILQLKDPNNFVRKQYLVARYFDEQCRKVFTEVMLKSYPPFQSFGVFPPTLKIRNMKTQWGNCTPKKHAITLNSQLIEAPLECIEYVVMHELCHLAHPNHSKNFYELLSVLMPDWKRRKEILNKNTYRA